MIDLFLQLFLMGDKWCITKSIAWGRLRLDPLCGTETVKAWSAHKKVPCSSTRHFFILFLGVNLGHRHYGVSPVKAHQGHALGGSAHG